MKITEHQMRGLLAGKCLPGDMRVNEELSAYLVRKFSELQQKLDALAAENALMLADYRDIPEMRRIGSPLTPTTDAYLNSVRAEGVEMLALAHQKIVDSLDGDSLFADFERKHKNICSAAITFADKLRSGTHDTADKAG